MKAMKDRKRKTRKPAPTLLEIAFRTWEETGESLPLLAAADWCDENGRPALAERMRAVATDEDVRFFYANAMWSCKPGEETAEEGRLRGAVRLATAEKWREENGFVARWEADDDYNPNDYDTDMPPIGWGCIVECECCAHLLVRARPHPQIASFWAVTFRGDGRPDSNPYKRVFEAEVSAEVMDECESQNG